MKLRWWFVGEKPFFCPVCNRGFATKGTMKQHLVIHGSLRPYLCDHCGFSTKFQSHLHAHQRTHTGIVGSCVVFVSSFNYVSVCIGFENIILESAHVTWMTKIQQNLLYHELQWALEVDQEFSHMTYGRMDCFLITAAM